jgi:PKD repeat protein
MKQKLIILSSLWLFLLQSLSMYGITDKANEPNLNSNFTVMEAPAPGFTYVSDGGCAPVTVQFYSQLNGPAYAWDFGDGGMSPDCNPVHTYTTPGTYTVTLVATGGTYTTTITVGAKPVVTFTGKDYTCLGDVQNYTATSTIPAAAYNWNAQGGTVNSSTATTATVTWTTYGVNNLTYTITTAAGCTQTFVYKVKVLPPPMVNLPCCDKRENQNPDGSDVKGQGHEQGETTPGGPAPCSVCANGYNCYTGTVDQQFGLASDYTWVWTVTNGTIVSLSNDSTKACVVWGSSGTGTIKLEITNKLYGCKSIRECDVIINPGITPVFSVTGNCVNSPVNFDATATTPLSDIESFYWEFGDGYTETTAAPFASHQFTFTGTYTATLTITTNSGCKYKVTKTFNVISGTKPTIVCPGTVCEGSRQCYSTTYIAGATYTWNVVGDVVAQRTVSADGNEVCVTWGTGPAGSVTVTVTGGGYTCTNSATEGVAIVSTNIPIAGPDFICQNTTYTEVSTANYTGACYRWTINGTPVPASTSDNNTLYFDASLYASPIKIDVDVDYPLGCCHGTGHKVIKKLPQYTMNFYVSNVCIGSTNTYNLYFPAGPPSSMVSWSVDGGTIVASTASTVTVKWNTAGVGSITAGNNTPSEYCNDASNSTWNVTVWDKATGEDISGPTVVCAGEQYTYFHGFSNPTVMSTVTVLPGPLAQSSSPFSSDIKFPFVSTPTYFTISVTYDYTPSFLVNCGTTKTYQVLVVPTLIPTFTIPGGNVCQGDIVSYSCAMSDSSLYDWTVIGGSIISESYSAGTLTIQVQWNSTVTSSITVSNRACGTSNTQPIVVNGKPVVIITPDDVDCTTPNIQLHVAPIWTSFNWSSGGTSPDETIYTPGTYSVTVSNGVCSNTGSIYVPVVTPTAPTITSFTVTPPSSYACPRYQLICPVITTGSGTIVSYNWSFSGFNISSSTATCPSVALPTSAGLHTGTWSLTITDSYGCTSTLGGSLTDSCTMGTGGTGGTPCTTPYAATFTYGSYDPCTGLFSSSATNYTSVVWYFDDGHIAGGLNPTHIFATPCTRTAVVGVVDINGCYGTFTVSINVPYTIFEPKIVVHKSLCVGTDSITAQGIYQCVPGTYTESYSWVITPSAGGSPVYTATTTSPTLPVGTIGAIPAGDYTATVTMTIAGCSRTVSKNFNKGGVQAYFVSCGGCAGSPISFIDQSVPYSAPIIQWVWTMNNTTGPGSYNSFLQNPTVDFANPGLYNITLTVTDNHLCTHSYSTLVNIWPVFNPGLISVNGSPSPSFSNFTKCPEDVFTLDAPAGPYTYLWSNGSTAPSISVTDIGDYYVTVFNSNNCAKKLGPIRLFYKPAPQAIILSSATECAPRLLRALTGVGYTYMWNYPISSTSTASFINLYNSGPVTLKVTNVHGCVSTITTNYNVVPTPYAYATYTPPPFCPGSTVTVTAVPSGGTAPYTHLWNNGGTSPSFTTTNPGTYIDYIVDANGCKTEAQINLQPVLPSGMDKLPYGCFDVCNPVSFCTGTMPYGWTGQWYLNGSTYGGTIPAYGNIAVLFSSPGVYELHYNSIDPTIYCDAVSKTITINFISLPTFTITSSVNPPAICIGSSTGTVLTVNPQDPMYNYTWYFNGVNVGTGFTYHATAPGTYTVEISKNPCCKKTVTIDVGEANCCFETPDVNFQQILSPITIYSNEFWHDKYYIDAVVTVASGVELDLTNVDCVFGPNGTIVFTGSSFFRCNNSVLRPCAKDDIWQGLYFYDESSGWINTTTIKNATVAVNLISNNRGVRLSDNTFLKCQVSVQMNNSYSQQSISGNTFEIDEVQLPYQTAPNDYYAIRLYDANFDGLIAQNDFRHVQPRKTSNRYYGIYSNYSSYTASENHFNDMFRSIDVTGNSGVVAIEDNDVKLNNAKERYDSYQIRVTDCDNPVLIYENKMENGLGDNSFAGAIYCEHTYRTHLKDNEINGFYNGIYNVRTESVHVTSNNITSSASVGIAVVEAFNSIISCNTIKSMATNSSTSGGPLYGIIDWYGDGSSNIYSNCIFNMNTSIYLIANEGLPMPVIANNYLYNYKDNGVYNDGYSGNIGFPGGATAAGRNTFMSNNGNTGGTFDINSTVLINEAGNFGILLTNNVNSLTPTDRYYSTSDCGHQIQSSYPKNQLDKYNTCDIYNLYKWVKKDDNGKYVMIAPAQSLSAEYISQAIKEHKTEVVGQIAASMMVSATDAKRTADAVLASEMDKNVAAKIIVNTCLFMDNAQMASSYLASSQLASIDADLRQVLTVAVELQNNPELTASQAQSLTVIDNANVRYSPIARDIIQAKNGEHDYKFYKMGEPTFEKPNNVLERVENSLTVYPVPTKDQVFLKHSVNDAKVQGIKIISALGAQVEDFTYTVQSGEIELNVSTLAAGVYTIILETDSKSSPMMTGRFIIVK